MSDVCSPSREGSEGVKNRTNTLIVSACFTSRHSKTQRIPTCDQSLREASAIKLQTLPMVLVRPSVQSRLSTARSCLFFGVRGEAGKATKVTFLRRHLGVLSCFGERCAWSCALGRVWAVCLDSGTSVVDGGVAMSMIKRVMVNRRPAASRVPERRLCNYMHRVCLQGRVEGYEYCTRHILEDKTAPFRQCAYTHAQSGRRCAYAAPKTDKRESLCQFHARKALQHRRSSSKKQHLVETPQKVIEALEHYCRDPQHSVDQSDTARNTVKFYDVESDDDTLADDRQFAGDSDADSVDNEAEDPLRHAGAFTVEEAASITRDKLVRLQSLYLGQFRRLRHVLADRRREYMRERGGPGRDLASPQDEAQYRRYRAYYRYHRCHGAEAVLRSRLKARQRADGPPSRKLCAHPACARAALPLAKLCRQHILHDRRQQLYESCPDCSAAFLRVRGPGDSCLLHTAPMPALPTFSEPLPDLPDMDQFQSMDDIAALGLDVVQPGSLFGLNQFGDPGESTDSALSDDGGPILALPADILADVVK